MKDTRTPKPSTISSIESATPSSSGSVNFRKAGIHVKYVAFLSANTENPIPSSGLSNASEKRVRLSATKLPSVSSSRIKRSGVCSYQARSRLSAWASYRAKRSAVVRERKSPRIISRARRKSGTPNQKRFASLTKILP